MAVWENRTALGARSCLYVRQVQKLAKCEPPRGEQLTLRRGSRNFASAGPSVTGPGGSVVVRRLIASIVLVACLLGIVQPAFACVSPSNCCLSDCDGQMPPGSGWDGKDDCCAIRAAVTASVSLAPQLRQKLDGAGGSPASITVAADPQPAPPRETPVPRPSTGAAIDQSLTYLHTARLRL